MTRPERGRLPRDGQAPDVPSWLIARGLVGSLRRRSPRRSASAASAAPDASSLGLVLVVQVDDLAVGVLDRGRLDDDGQRLAAGDLADEHRHLAALDDGLGELVGAHAGGLRTAHEVLGELLLADVQLLLVDQLVEDELGLDALLRLLLESRRRTPPRSCPGSRRYFARSRPIWPSWWCSRLCLRVLTSSSSSFSGIGHLDQLEQLVQDPLLGLRWPGRTASCSRAACGCPPAAPRGCRTRSPAARSRRPARAVRGRRPG